MASSASEGKHDDLCLACGKVESDDVDWVQCKNCERWAHFSCVNVDEKIVEVDWLCPQCVPNVQSLSVPKQSKKSSKKISKSDVGSHRGTGSVLNLTEQQLEEEQLARETEFAKQMEIRRKRIALEMAWNEKQMEQEREIRKMELQARREMQNRQLMEENQMLEAQLADEQNFIKQRDEIRAKMNRSIQNVRTELKNANGVGRTLEPEKTKTVNDWLKRQDSCDNQEHGRSENVVGMGTSNRINEIVEGPASLASGEAERESDFGDANSNVRINTLPANRFGEGTVNQVARLTPDQLATRKAICNSLPKFNGDAQIWPLFISSYDHSTAACGYNNLENLKRLQDSLEGDALNAVRSMLVLPDSVPEVIEDLRRLFGQPEKLMRTLFEKVKHAPAPKADRLGTFISFGITVKQLCDHLEAARLNDHLNNPMMVQELVDKLPPSYKLEWVRFKRGREGTPLRKFTNFITEIVADVSEVADFSVAEKDQMRPARTSPSKKEYVHLHDSGPERSATSQGGTFSKACWICNRTDHMIKFCDDFKKMNLADRLKAVEREKLCGICLNKHGSHRCNSKIRCNIKNCRGNHHPLLHRAEGTVQMQKVVCNTHDEGRTVIFRVVPVTLHAGNNRFDTLAFLDEGSSTTLVDEIVANHLQVTGKSEPLIVTWTGNVNRFENSSRKIEISLSARGSKRMFPLANVRTVAKLDLPKQELRFSQIAGKYKHLEGVPVLDYPLEQPTILIGLDNVHLFAPLESRVGAKNEPIAVRTKMGWTIYGPEKNKAGPKAYLNLHSTLPVSNQQLHDMLQTQYVLDETGVSCFAIPEPKEDMRAKDILKTTTKRVGKHFETGLLWREDKRRFPDNYSMAVRRMQALERKLSKTPALKQNVCQQIVDYQVKGYAHKATESELTETPPEAVWYLPLNVVVNPRKPEKVRLVWDAAASIGGISLNSELIKGPDMLVPLPRVICHFRERPVAFGGDIKEMYHQILIRQEDKQAQRFLFRASSAEAPQVYIMDVATFGSTCSPCQAQYVKNRNAESFAENYPEAVEAIISRHYVDDYYDSVNTTEEAIKRAEEVKYIHSQAGFHIRNWVSNSAVFLEHFGEGIADSTVHFNRDKGTEYERVLGVVWESTEDVFCFASASKTEFSEILQGNECPTKRMVLSFVMAQFDPAGFLAPLVVRGKMLVQDLWRSGCEWDDRIDDVSFKKWMRWTQLMRQVELIKIPRSYFGNAMSHEIQDLQLHIFADASETAYGCVAYFRAIIRERVSCALVMSRSKVAPLKQISIPRLELLAAVLAARLQRTVVENHTFTINKVVYWIDANVVLSWIRSDQRRYKPFVGFRIGEILSLTKLDGWRWVPTRLNVADTLTKWDCDLEFHSDSSWVHGPAFLYKKESEWPQRQLPPANTTEELRVHLLLHNVVVPEDIINANNISKWPVLVRAVASALRFISNCKRKSKGLPIELLKATNNQAKLLQFAVAGRVHVPLQQSEYQKAEEVLLKMAQTQCFIDELKVLKRNKEFPVDQWLAFERSSPLHKLTPMLDEIGLIRMEGRSAPHMGGVWERLVRSVKEILKTLDDGKQLTDEILWTALAEAEDIINSRPLTFIRSTGKSTNIFITTSSKHVAGCFPTVSGVSMYDMETLDQRVRSVLEPKVEMV
ncbi:uncharacterized protein LOC128741013 [Sabethes cyaneus]|uniref:uncharacterized protein LOC128741013 n=1 Tax=Sabethes cyaneus TaxID=53552 RepID=UPI00237DC438|nr:uncharacterized protein LOC128741013 [Sabethes cyaneus]